MPSVSDISPEFSKHIRSLEQLNALAAGAVLSGGRREWYVPPNAGSLDINNPTAVTASFSRTALNSSYEQVMKSGGTVGDRTALKRQLDYIATLERSYRAARASSIRCRAMSAGRSKGHSSSAGIFGGHVMREIQDVIRNAKESR